jgi:hypothetical protein
MKALKKIVLLITLSALSLTATIAQNYKAPAIDFSGKIKNESGTSLGAVSKEGIIKNHNGEKIAFINDKGQLVDSSGKVMGKPEKNGNFHNIDGELEFTVKPSTNDQCEVLDKDGKVVLVAHNSYKARAGAIAHCMKANMLK